MGDREITAAQRRLALLETVTFEVDGPDTSTLAFLVVSTPVFHDFWAAPEDQRQSEMTNFLKNVAMLGGALGFLALSNVAWPYALGVGV